MLYLDGDVGALTQARVKTCGASLAGYRRGDDHWTTRILAAVVAGLDEDWFSAPEGQALIADKLADRLPGILGEGHPGDPFPAYHCFRRYQERSLS